MKKKLVFMLPLYAAAISIVLFQSACKKETTPAVIPAPTATGFFLKGTLGNSEISITGIPQPITETTNPVSDDDDDDNPSHNNNGNSHHNSNSDDDDDNDQNGGDDDDNTTVVTGTGFYGQYNGTPTLTGSISLHKIIMRIYIAPAMQSTHFGMLAPGTYPLVNGNKHSAGALIKVLDSNGVLWTSAGDQTGSTFTITSRSKMGTDAADFAGTFSVKMYNGNGNMLPFTNGTFAAQAGL